MSIPLMPSIVVAERSRGCMPGYNGERRSGSQWTAAGNVVKAVYAMILRVHSVLISLHLLYSQSFEWETQSKKWCLKMLTIFFLHQHKNCDFKIGILKRLHMAMQKCEGGRRCRSTKCGAEMTLLELSLLSREGSVFWRSQG
eukprot:11512154-Ditylum_brightwellii.AAC.1